MTATLRLKSVPPGESASATKASQHDLYIEPGDSFRGQYSVYSINELGEYVEYDVSAWTITATAHSSDFQTVENFVVTVEETTVGSGIKNKILFSLTAGQTTNIGKNPRFSWGMRFTNKIDATNTFTFMTGTIHAEEGSLI